MNLRYSGVMAGERAVHKRFDGLKFNRYGLLDADLSVAKNIASEIQGKGEPVDWIPVEICKPDIT